MAVADTVAWYLVMTLVAVVLLTSLQDKSCQESVGHNRALKKGCDELYVVSEGETLHTITDKCGDPFIVENNPHIHDPDDVFPGLVIRIFPVSDYPTKS